MLLKDMKAASGGDLKLAVSVIYMTLEVSAVMTYFTWPLKASTISEAWNVLIWLFNKNGVIYTDIYADIYNKFYFLFLWADRCFVLLKDLIAPLKRSTK